MFVTPLNTRRKEALQAIVEEYIQTAAPVSSQMIARKMRSAVSSATVRNIMAELDELGLVWQPHTSAGRIPTDRGYRYYIDSLLEVDELPPEERALIQRQYPSYAEISDELLREILRVLSNYCGYTALAFSSFAQDRLYVERISYILEYPEFRDAQKLQLLLRMLEKREPLLEIMKADLNTDGVCVHIGKENPYEEIQECSLVVSGLKMGNEKIGTLGIIGPRRMSYAKVISTVGYVAEVFNQRFTDDKI